MRIQLMTETATMVQEMVLRYSFKNDVVLRNEWKYRGDRGVRESTVFLL